MAANTNIYRLQAKIGANYKNVTFQRLEDLITAIAGVKVSGKPGDIVGTPAVDAD